MIALKSMALNGTRINKMAKENTYHKVTKDHTVSAHGDRESTNHHYGSSEIFRRKQKPVTAKKGDEIHDLVGGRFLVRKGGKEVHELHTHKGEKSPFERGDDATHEISKEHTDRIEDHMAIKVPRGGYRSTLHKSELFKAEEEAIIEHLQKSAKKHGDDGLSVKDKQLKRFIRKQNNYLEENRGVSRSGKSVGSHKEKLEQIIRQPKANLPKSELTKAEAKHFLVTDQAGAEHYVRATDKNSALSQHKAGKSINYSKPKTPQPNSEMAVHEVEHNQGRWLRKGTEMEKAEKKAKSPDKKAFEKDLGDSLKTELNKLNAEGYASMSDKLKGKKMEKAEKRTDLFKPEKDAIDEYMKKSSSEKGVHRQVDSFDVVNPEQGSSKAGVASKEVKNYRPNEIAHGATKQRAINEHKKVLSELKEMPAPKLTKSELFKAEEEAISALIKGNFSEELEPLEKAAKDGWKREPGYREMGGGRIKSVHEHPEYGYIIHHQPHPTESYLSSHDLEGNTEHHADLAAAKAHLISKKKK